MFFNILAKNSKKKKNITIEMLNNLETIDEDENMVEDIDLSDEPKINKNINITLGSDYSVTIGKVSAKKANDQDYQFEALMLYKKYKDENGSDKVFSFSMPLKLIPKLHTAIGMILQNST